MEKWIIRGLGLLCALGGAFLFWMLGAFTTALWHEGRLFSPVLKELQLIAIPVLLGTLVGWGALRIFRASDLDTPKVYPVIRALLLVTYLAAAASGVFWTLTRFP